MTKTTTAQTLGLLKIIGGLAFRPMTDNDFAAFEGAEADAQIADGTDDLAEAMSQIAGVKIEGGDMVIAIVSGGKIEFHGTDDEFAPVAIGFDIADLI